MCRSTALPFLLIPICLFFFGQAQAQQDNAVLQPGKTLERTIARGQVQHFSITLEQDQFLQLVVDQHGIDVVVRVTSPEGRSLGEFDSPNGNEGPEDVTVTSSTAGTYYVEVRPLGQFEEEVSGRYEIRIVELRHATEQELQAGKNQEVRKAQGIALMTKLTETLPEIRLPQTRVRAQTQAARLLWASDEKLAGKLISDAVAGVREYIERVDSADQEYYQSYTTAMQLRQDVFSVLADHDPEAALTFLRSTRTLASPDEGQRNSNLEQERRFELSVANQIIAKDPKRAFQIAEETMKNGYSSGLTDTIAGLREVDPESAGALAKEIAAKLSAEKFTVNPEAGNLAVNLLRLAHTPRNQRIHGNAAPPDNPLLSEQEYRDLFKRTLTAGLTFTPVQNNFYSLESNAARIILNSLKSMTAELESYAPGSSAAVEKKTIELNTPPDQQTRVWQKYQETINSGSIEEGLEAVGQAPPEVRDSLYQQLASKAEGSGDPARARQIVMDHILNPVQRQQILSNLERQEIYNAISRGKIEEALRSISSLRTPKERANMLSQIVNQIGPGKKRAAALSLLEQARSMLGASPQAEDQEQMNALLQISLAFSRYDPKRAFEVIEPLLDQFNEMSTAAVALNGFGQQYYQDGELIMQNENAVAIAANQIIPVLATLAVADFDRAKADVDRLQRPEVRVGAILAIAQQMINPQPSQLRVGGYRRVSE